MAILLVLGILADSLELCLNFKVKHIYSRVYKHLNITNIDYISNKIIRVNIIYLGYISAYKKRDRSPKIEEI